MTLPASGQISFNDLRVELGIPSQAPFSITTAATSGYVAINTNSPSRPNSSTPHAISEWYSYNHNYSTTTTTTTSTSTTTTTQACNTYSGFEFSNIQSLTECFTGAHSDTVYSTCATLTTGCVLYQTTGCVDPYNLSTYIQEGDGTNYEVNGSGVILNSNNPNC